MIDWLNDNSGAVQAASAFVLALTFIAVAYYAKQTRKQAEASERMAEEMREQRMAGDRPYLLVDLMRPDALEWPGRLNKVSVGPLSERAEEESRSWLGAYPKSVPCRIYNAGRGPAKEICATMLHPEEIYKVAERGFLLPGETWDVEIEQKGEHTIVVRKTQPDHLDEWLKLQGINGVESGPYNAGIVVDYRDIHDGLWATYLILGLSDDRVVVGGEVEIRRALVPLEQRRIQSKRYVVEP